MAIICFKAPIFAPLDYLGSQIKVSGKQRSENGEARKEK